MDPIAKLVDDAGLEGLDDVGDDLAGRAALDAPIEEGTLRGSTSTKTTRRPGGGGDVVVAFSTPYAARQHEETTWEHPRGGKAKYLEDNLKAQAGNYRRHLRDKVAEALRRGF